jgi:F-type H+-transporting ATPase subunit a
MTEHTESGPNIEGPLIHIPFIPEILTMSFIVIFIFLLLAIIVRRSIKVESKGLQNVFELIIEFIESQIESVIGKEGKKFTPFFCTLFIYILLCNLIGLLPGFKSPTSNLTNNLALAGIVFISTHFYGMKKKGVIGYLKHFMGPPYWLAPLFLPIHIIGELAKPLSLSMRLFGNILAKEILLGVLAYVFTMLYFSTGAASKILMIVPILLRPAIILLGVLVSIIQALVFTMLSMLYIGSAIETHNEH